MEQKLPDFAPGAVFRRGLAYAKEGRVLTCERLGGGLYAGTVRGGGDAVYDVFLDLAHPEDSTCTCPFAEDTRLTCKHQVALYYALFPEELSEAEEREARIRAREEERRRREMLRQEVQAYVDSLDWAEQRDELVRLLMKERESEKDQKER